LGDAPSLVICYRLLARVHRARGEVGEALQALVAAMIVALQIHPQPVLEALDDVVTAAKGLGEQGEWWAVFNLRAGIFQALEEMAQQGIIREEMKPWATLVEGICRVVGGAAALRLGAAGEEARARVRALAQDLDEATGGGGGWRSGLVVGSGESVVGSGESVVGSGESVVGSGESVVGSGKSVVGSGGSGGIESLNPNC